MAVGVPSLAAATAAAPDPSKDENSALIAAWKQFRFAEDEFQEAKEALQWLVDEWKHLWPRASESARWHGSLGGEVEVDMAGRSYRDEKGRVIFLKTREQLAESREWAVNRRPRTRVKDQEKEKQRRQKWERERLAEIEAAEAYYVRVAEVRKEAGADAAHSRVDRARKKLEELADRVSRERALTLYGVRLQADVFYFTMENMGLSERASGFVGEAMRLSISVLVATEHLDEGVA